MSIPETNHPTPNELADQAEDAVARMTEVVRDGKEQIKRLHKIMAKIDRLEAAKQ